MFTKVAPLQCHACVLYSVQLRSEYAQKMRAPNNALQSSIHARKCTKRSVWQSICLLFIVFLYSDVADIPIETLPKALRTQALTALTSKFGLVLYAW